MNYLLPSDYEPHGIEAQTPAAWIAAASALIDAHCRRPTLAVQPYTERHRLQGGRHTLRLTYLPLATVAPATSPIVSVRARYAEPRHGADELAVDVSRLFNLPGSWSALDPASLDVATDTGEITLPLNPLAFYYNEVEVTYNAGLATIPEPVKIACAQLVRNAQATPALNVRAGSIDQMHMEYFADTLLDESVRSLLAPWVAQKVG